MNKILKTAGVLPKARTPHHSLVYPYLQYENILWENTYPTLEAEKC